MNKPGRTLAGLSVGGLMALGVIWMACAGGSPGFTSPPPPPPPPTDKPASIQVVSGAGQSTAVANQLPAPLVVQVMDSASKPLASVPLTWSLQFGGGAVTPIRFNTDASGQASANFTVGSSAGVDSVKANVTGTSLNAFFAATAVTPPPPDTSWPNQPAGFTVITNRAFDADGEDGWTSNQDGGNHFSIVSDPLAPRSPPHIAQADFPIGYSLNGNDAVDTHIGVASYNYTQLYMSFWVKLSSNWVPHPSGVNKIGFVWIAGNPSVYTSFHFASVPMRPQVDLQNVPGGAQSLTPNVNAVQINPGTWYRWEIILVCNTAGNADGSAQWWINGTEVGHYTNLQYVTSGSSHIWGSGGDGVSWKPVYGGSASGTLAVDQQMWMDHWYISGHP